MVDAKRKLAEIAIENARSALKHGNRLDAKEWAEQAGQLAPEMEDPWLVLAYLAEPAEGLKYLEKALTLNPSSNRTWKGIHFLIKKITDQKQPIPYRHEKFYESESISSQPAEKNAGDNQFQRNKNPVPIKEQPRDNFSDQENQISNTLEKTMGSPEVASEVILDEEKIESLAENHLAKDTEIKSITVSESASPPENNTMYNMPLSFSRKQPHKNQGGDWLSIFISLFSLLILSITILAILYTNHLLPFLK